MIVPSLRVLENVQLGSSNPVAVLEVTDDCTVFELHPLEEARRLAKQFADAFPAWTVRVWPVDALEVVVMCPVTESEPKGGEQ